MMMIIISNSSNNNYGSGNRVLDTNNPGFVLQVCHLFAE